MAKLIKFLFLLVCVIFTFTSCEVIEGEGGSSSISGKLFVRDFDSEGFLIQEYYAGEWAVYIIYGDEEIYSDRMDTHFDGGYKFSALYPGDYTIFAYSKCDTCPGEFEVISVDVQLERGQDLVLDDIVVSD